MNDAPRHNGSSLAKTPRPHCSNLYLWWLTWRAARAAEHAYERARADGLPRDAAASSAFKALNTDDPLADPEQATAAQPAPLDAALPPERASAPLNAVDRPIATA